MQNLILSDQQRAIVEAVARSDSDLQVIARAGCGKTTTILAACNVARGRVAFFAFNKSIATELAEKAPSHVKVQTLHSLGFGAIRYAIRAGVAVEADKTFLILKPLLRPGESDLIGHVKKLVSLCKNNLVEPTEETLLDLANEYDVQVNGDSERVFDLVRQVLAASVPKDGPAVIDYDDMIWLPSVMNLRPLMFEWVFVDEAQDMNAAQQALVLKVIGRTGRICYVGDPMQAIYHFRGADVTAMDTMARRLRALGRTVNTYPLTKTRRCPTAIVNLARQYAPDFEALPDAPAGIVRTSRDLNVAPGDMVLCRLNAPLIPTAYSLLRAGVPVKINGRDIGAGLIAVINKVHASNIDDLVAKLDEYRVKETARLQRQYVDKPSKLETALVALNDKVDTIVSLAAGQNTIDALVSSIERLFADVHDARSVVLLSTVHRAKGLEAPRVWIIETKPLRGPQENNIRYVAVTRAKQELVLVHTTSSG